MRRFSFLGLMLVALSLPIIFLGCGGGSNALAPTPVAKTSALAFSVKWPAATRMIPQMANSIRVDILCADGHADSRILNRPPEGEVSSTTFEQLAAGLVTVTAIAFPAADATGTAQARGQASKAILAAQTAQLTVTMSSTIIRVDVFAPLGPPPLEAGTTQQLAATPYDANGNVVLVADDGFAWQTNLPVIATVDPHGLVTGMTGGSVIIHATENESGVTGTITLTIPYTLSVNAIHGSVIREPSQASYTAGTLVTLTANPDAGYHFTRWSGDLSDTTSAAQITMDGNKTVTANFSLGPAPLDLGSAGTFAILAGATVTNTGPTLINGDLGVSPGTALTGFPPGIVNGAIHLADATVAAAKLAVTNAYIDATERALNVVTVSTGELGGLTLAPGLYQSGISSFAITSVDLTLDAQGDQDAVWIFQMPSSTLTVGNGRKVILAGGAQAANIYWQVGSSATLGTTSVVAGNILAQASITLQTGATLTGRALTQIAAVSLDSNTVTVPVNVMRSGRKSQKP